MAKLTSFAETIKSSLLSPNIKTRLSAFEEADDILALGSGDGRYNQLVVLFISDPAVAVKIISDRDLKAIIFGIQTISNLLNAEGTAATNAIRDDILPALAVNCLTNSDKGVRQEATTLLEKLIETNCAYTVINSLLIYLKDELIKNPEYLVLSLNNIYQKFGTNAISTLNTIELLPTLLKSSNRKLVSETVSLVSTLYSFLGTPFITELIERSPSRELKRISRDFPLKIGNDNLTDFVNPDVHVPLDEVESNVIDKYESFLKIMKPEEIEINPVSVPTSTRSTRNKTKRVKSTDTENSDLFVDTNEGSVEVEAIDPDLASIAVRVIEDLGGALSDASEQLEEERTWFYINSEGEIPEVPDSLPEDAPIFSLQAPIDFIARALASTRWEERRDSIIEMFNEVANKKLIEASSTEGQFLNVPEIMEGLGNCIIGDESTQVATCAMALYTVFTLGLEDIAPYAKTMVSSIVSRTADKKDYVVFVALNACIHIAEKIGSLEYIKLVIHQAYKKSRMSMKRIENALRVIAFDSNVLKNDLSNEETLVEIMTFLIESLQDKKARVFSLETVNIICIIFGDNYKLVSYLNEILSIENQGYVSTIQEYLDVSNVDVDEFGPVKPSGVRLGRNILKRKRESLFQPVVKNEFKKPKVERRERKPAVKKSRPKPKSKPKKTNGSKAKKSSKKATTKKESNDNPLEFSLVGKVIKDIELNSDSSLEVAVAEDAISFDSLSDEEMISEDESGDIAGIRGLKLQLEEQGMQITDLQEKLQIKDEKLNTYRTSIKKLLFERDRMKEHFRILQQKYEKLKKVTKQSRRSSSIRNNNKNNNNSGYTGGNDETDENKVLDKRISDIIQEKMDNILPPSSRGQTPRNDKGRFKKSTGRVAPQAATGSGVMTSSRELRSVRSREQNYNSSPDLDLEHELEHYDVREGSYRSNLDYKQRHGNTYSRDLLPDDNFHNRDENLLGYDDYPGPRYARPSQLQRRPSPPLSLSQSVNKRRSTNYNSNLSSEVRNLNLDENNSLRRRRTILGNNNDSTPQISSTRAYRIDGNENIKTAHGSSSSLFVDDHDDDFNLRWKQEFDNISDYDISS